MFFTAFGIAPRHFGHKPQSDTGMICFRFHALSALSPAQLSLWVLAGKIQPPKYVDEECDGNRPCLCCVSLPLGGPMGGFEPSLAFPRQQDDNGMDPACARFRGGSSAMRLCGAQSTAASRPGCNAMERWLLWYLESQAVHLFCIILQFCIFCTVCIIFHSPKFDFFIHVLHIFTFPF